ncbi:MAG: GNAT family N-acetyltransferase [Thermoplasmata archaeon]
MARCHRNFVEGFWQYTKSTPGASRRSSDGGTLLRSGIAASQANIWFLEEPTGSLDTIFEEATAYFGPNRPWRVIAAGSQVEEVHRVAAVHRLTPIASEPGMILDPMPAPPSPVPGLSIRTVDSPATLEDFGTAWCAAFGIPRWIFDMVLPTVLADDRERGTQNRFLVGYAGGGPVACSSVIVSEGVAGILSVGTTRAARGHGYGTALTWQAVEEGRRLGADVAYLSATSMGYPVYERMGFRRVAEYPSWATPVGFFRQIRLVLGMWQVARASRRRGAPRVL